MGADDARLIERPVWDSSGMERIPFDGSTGVRLAARIRSGRTSSRNHGPQCSSNPEIGCQCGYDEGEHVTEPADGYQRAGKVRPGMTVHVHGSVRVTILSVERCCADHSSPWVTLNYQQGTYVNGDPIIGRYSLPASQCLRVL